MPDVRSYLSTRINSLQPHRMEKQHMFILLWITFSAQPRQFASKRVSPVGLPPDQIQEPELVSLLGLKLALEKEPNELSRFIGFPARTTTQPTITVLAQHRSDSSFSPDVRIYAHTSGNQWSVVCEVESMQLNHNVHLVCPLMQPRCFENCKRICEPTGCVLEPSLAEVLCTTRQTEPTVSGGFVRRFEYQIDRYDKNITGSWSCLFAGTESEKILLSSIESTTTTTTTTTTATTPITTTTITTTPKVKTTPRAKGTSITLLQTNRKTTNISMESNKPLFTSTDAITNENNSTYLLVIGTNQASQGFRAKINTSAQSNPSMSNETNAYYSREVNQGIANPIPAVPVSAFLTYITSNVQLVLGFMALLALSLLTNLIFCLQFLRISRRRAKTEVEQSPFSHSSNETHGMNNSADGSFKIARSRDTSCYANCRPTSWISPIANNSAAVEMRKLSGCAVPNSKSCHFGSLALALGSDNNTLINPVTSPQYHQLQAAPLRYWAASPMTTSLYRSTNESCETSQEPPTQTEPSTNMWTNSSTAMKSSCSFSSNGFSADDQSGVMHRSITLPFSKESECSQLQLPMYMPTMTVSRAPSQTSVGVRLLPSYGLPRWYTPPQKCSSKVRLLPKASREAEDDVATLKRTRFDNGPSSQYPVPLVVGRQIFVKKTNPLGSAKSAIVTKAVNEQELNADNGSNGHACLTELALQEMSRYPQCNSHRMVAESPCTLSTHHVLNVQ